jgi:hypothetical protein
LQLHEELILDANENGSPAVARFVLLEARLESSEEVVAALG